MFLQVKKIYKKGILKMKVLSMSVIYAIGMSFIITGKYLEKIS